MDIMCRECAKTIGIGGFSPEYDWSILYGTEVRWGGNSGIDSGLFWQRPCLHNARLKERNHPSKYLNDKAEIPIAKRSVKP